MKENNFIFEFNSQHGIIPLLDLLSSNKVPSVHLAALNLLNTVTVDADTLETVCYLGGLTLIVKYTDVQHDMKIRAEAGRLVRKLVETSDITRRCFISCGGLKILMRLLSVKYVASPELIFIGIDSLWTLLASQVIRYIKHLSSRHQVDFQGQIFAYCYHRTGRLNVYPSYCPI